jgi:hypothetical protein
MRNRWHTPELVRSVAHAITRGSRSVRRRVGSPRNRKRMSRRGSLYRTKKKSVRPLAGNFTGKGAKGAIDCWRLFSSMPLTARRRWAKPTASQPASWLYVIQGGGQHGQPEVASP